MKIIRGPFGVDVERRYWDEIGAWGGKRAEFGRSALAGVAKGFGFLVEDGGQLVAAANTFAFEGKSQLALNYLAAQKGYGAAAMRQVAADAAELGFSLHLHAIEEAKPFYEKIGMRLAEGSLADYTWSAQEATGFAAGPAGEAQAIEAGQEALGRLVRTDLQLAQTHAARDWMEGDERVYGYKRVLAGGKSCALCRAASTRIYYRESLMPIHERCHCTVEPLFGEHPGGLSVPDAAVRVADDPELGPRLLEESWAA